ncbi:acyltransferase family protein [Oceanospirillum sediminis]|uniref:Acyltransferase n=1 Tax=Oceanospirillum sediminis TaxID=2760088 RepID=A0A839IUE1_9GAMM|nr:acyltransferase [Oceanospirillum sediminis]MBB1488300.1 acyltransferase [Oceanospirillum sediminis]
MKISDFADATDNNFNLIRLICAWFVIVSHSYPLALGAENDTGDLLARLTGLPLSHLGVSIFFIISGFLIVRSAITGSGFLSYAISRAIRIFPALIVAILLSVAVLGPAVTSLSLEEYFSHRHTLAYLANNIWLFDGMVQYQLPGVFNENPYPNVVNGSLWTLPIEIQMYIATAVGIFSIRVLFRKNYLLIYKIVVPFLTAVLIMICYQVPREWMISVAPVLPDTLKLAATFGIGSSLYVLREYIPLKAGILLVLALFYPVAGSLNLMELYITLLLAYSVFWLAYIPSGAIRRFNYLGDYSYGLYIYAFPVQQLLAHYTTLSVIEMIISTTFITLAISVISWHWLEKPAISQKKNVIRLCLNVKGGIRIGRKKSVSEV